MLVEQGYEVIGLMRRLWAEKRRGHRCCTTMRGRCAPRDDLLDISFLCRDYRHLQEYCVTYYRACKGLRQSRVCATEIRFDKFSEAITCW